MQGDLLRSLTLVFAGYLQNMSTVLPAIRTHVHAPHHWDIRIHVAWQCMLYGLCGPSALRQCPFGLILCELYSISLPFPGLQTRFKFPDVSYEEVSKEARDLIKR